MNESEQSDLPSSFMEIESACIIQFVHRYEVNAATASWSECNVCLS